MSAPQKIHLDALHPYPGPSSFDEDHAAFFCGRDREAEELFALVELRPLTVVYGKSGLGKTSLLQAGLFPRMRKAGLVPIRVRLGFGVDEHGERHPPLADQVRRRLREAIDRDELDGAPPRDGESLWEYFHWTGFWDAEGRPVSAVLVLDQFEEVFTLGHERRRELAALMREVSDLVENRIPAAAREGGAELPPSYDKVPAKVLIALREEFLAQLDDYRQQMPSLSSGRYRLRPLGGADAMTAVLQPGREVVTEDVAGRIVRRVASAPDDAALSEIEEVEPALLALYCHELNALRDKAKLPKIDVALLQGSEQEILDKFYDRCMAGMPKEVHRLVEEQLLTPDDRRDTIAFGRAKDLGVDPRDLTTLVDRRLLRKVPLLGHEYVQIVHDKLVPTIAKRRLLRQRRDESQQLVRKIVRRLGSVATVLVGIAGVAVFVRSQAQEAAARADKIAEARKQIANAEQRAEEQAGIGWRMAADQRWDDVARQLVLGYRALEEARGLRRTFSSAIEGASPSPPELSLLSSRFEANAGELRALLGESESVERFVLSRDGLRGAALGADGRRVKLVDMESGKVVDAAEPGATGPIDDKVGDDVQMTNVFYGAVRELSLSGDGSLLFGVGDSGQVAVWDAAGSRVHGFRARLARPTFQVDRTGARVLVVDRDAGRAIVVTLKMGDDRGLTAVNLTTQPRETAPAPAPTNARNNTRRRVAEVANWRGFALAADGSRVVGLREELAERADGRRERRIQTEIALWDTSGSEAIASATLPGRVESAAVSDDGKLLATRSDERELPGVRDADRTLRVSSLGARQITARGLPAKVSADAWIAFHETSPTLLVAANKTLTLWDVAADPKPKQEVSLGARARKAALSRDGALALVWLDEEVRLYDMKLGQPRAAASIPEAERRWAAGVDVELRFAGDAARVVTAKGDGIRARALGALGKAPIDRYLWGESSAARARFSGMIPRGGVVEDVDGDGEQIAVLADGAVSLVRASGQDKLDIAPLAVRDAAIGKSLTAAAAAQDQSVRAIGLRAGHVVAVDAGGALRFGDPRFATLRRAPGDAAWGGILALSPDGVWAVTGGRDARVWVWDTDNAVRAWAADARQKQSRGSLGPEVEVTAIAIAGDGGRARAIVGDARGHVRAMRPTGDEKSGDWTSERVDAAPHERWPVRAIEIAADGRFATGSDDGTVALWDKDGKLARKIPAQTPEPVRALRFADDGRVLLAAAGRAVRAYKTTGDAAPCVLDHADAVADVTVEGTSEGSAGARAASVDASGNAIVWTVAGCTPLRTLRGMAYAGFLSAARDRVVTVRRTGRVELWAAADMSADDHGDRPSGASTWGAFLGSGTLLTGDEENAIFRWRDVGPSAEPARLAGEIGGVVAVASGGDRVVAATAEGLVRAWSGTATGDIVSDRLPLARGLSLRAAALDDGGKQLFTVEDGPDDRPRVRLSSVPGPGFKAGEPKDLPTGDGCGALASAPAGRFFAAPRMEGTPSLHALVIESSGCVRLWDKEGNLRVEGGSQEASDASGRISAAALARRRREPDDQRNDPERPDQVHLILGTSEGAVSTWEIDDRPNVKARLRRLTTERRRHTARIRAIAFHPDGRFFVTAGDDAQVWLWDATDGRPLARLGTHPAPISWLAFKPDGSEVVTGGAGGFLRAFATRTHDDDPARVTAALHAWLPELDKPGP